MAEAIDIEDFNIEATTQHLQKGSFAPIFDHSTEKDDHTALKLMCIVDYKAQKWDLYTRIHDLNNPKLLAQLLQFHSYGTFKYYDYHVGYEIGKRVLQCKFCELIGPYGLILTHMVINHNAHIPSKTCAYCNRTDLRKHYDQNTLQDCYLNYVQRNDIEWNENVCIIISDFFAMLKALSIKFKINTVRTRSFAGRGFGSVERLDRGYDSDIDETIRVFKNRTPQMISKNISGRAEDLDEEFKRIISILYGGNNASRLMQRQSTTNADDIETIVISDDDDDGGENGGRSRATISNRSGEWKIATTSSTDAAAAAGAASDADNQSQSQRSSSSSDDSSGSSNTSNSCDSSESTISQRSCSSVGTGTGARSTNGEGTSTGNSTNVIESDPMTSQVPVKSEPASNVTPTTTTTATNVNGSPMTTDTTQNPSHEPTQQLSPTVPDAIPHDNAPPPPPPPPHNQAEKRLSDSELFGQYVVQRLNRQTDDLKRRKLENAIQEAIVKAEKELF